ncbi:hypothetical protein ACFL2T_01445 [Elusimicrobiota bacterium]
MSRWKALFLGPVVYVGGLALMMVALALAWKVMLFLQPYLPFLIDSAEVMDDSVFAWFFVVGLPAAAAGAIAAPPEGPGRWRKAFVSGMVSVALLLAPALLLVCYMLPSILDRSAGSDTMMVTGIVGFLAATQIMAGLGGILRYRHSRDPRRVSTRRKP